MVVERFTDLPFVVVGLIGACRHLDVLHCAGGARDELLHAVVTTLSLIPSFGACTRSCFVPRYRSVVWTDEWPSSN